MLNKKKSKVVAYFGKIETRRVVAYLKKKRGKWFLVLERKGKWLLVLKKKTTRKFWKKLGKLLLIKKNKVVAYFGIQTGKVVAQLTVLLFY